MNLRYYLPSTKRPNQLFFKNLRLHTDNKLVPKTNVLVTNLIALSATHWEFFKEHPGDSEVG